VCLLKKIKGKYTRDDENTPENGIEKTIKSNSYAAFWVKRSVYENNTLRFAQNAAYCFFTDLHLHRAPIFTQITQNSKIKIKTLSFH
jgi:hypothetical protein